MSDTKICPYCGSEISINVQKCKYCGEWLVLQEKDKPKASLHLGAWIEAIICIITVICMFTLQYNDGIILIIFAIYILLHLYFLPSLIADNKRTQYTPAIFALNFLLGVTLIFWIGALIWALSLPNLNKTSKDFEEITNKKNVELNELGQQDTNIEKYSTENHAKFPNEINGKFNWGAFWFSWIWGIANKSYLTLLTLIPCFNFVWMFVCGFKGNEWAWKNKSWTSIEEFTQVQKKWATISNIIVGIILVLSIVLLGIACIIEDNNLTITSVLSKCGATESYQEFEYSGNDEYVGTYNATKYTCNNENFNQVIRFKKDEKSSEETYAFRVETNEQAGNGGENFNYEIGRIVIDTVNPNSDKCTYNYRGNADWKPCSEKDFIKSLPKISSMKAKAYEPLKPLMKELIEWDIKGLNWAPDYDEQKAEETYEKYEKQLKILRNVSLDN